MRLRITKIDEEHFLTCLKFGKWGSKQARFSNWLVGDLLVLLVDKAVAGMAEVSGPFEVSQQRIWRDALYPYRISIQFLYAFLPHSRPPTDGGIKNALKSSWGPYYGLGMVSQRLVDPDCAQRIVEAIRTHHSDLDEVQQKIDQLLREAKA
jgi:hypothetical protein